MKKLLSLIVFGTLLSLPAFAQMEVKQIKVDQDKGWQKTSFEIQMMNPGDEIVYPSRIVLNIRETGESSWRTLKEWQISNAVAPGKSLKLKYQVKASGGADSLDPALKLKHFEVQAVVDGMESPLTTVEKP